MTKYIQGKDGKMAGSIGDGKGKVPSVSDLPPSTGANTNEAKSGDISSAYKMYRRQRMEAMGQKVGVGGSVYDAYKEVMESSPNEDDHILGFEMEWPDMDIETAKARLDAAGIAYDASDYQPRADKWHVRSDPTGGVSLTGPAGPLDKSSRDAYRVEDALVQRQSHTSVPHEVTAIVAEIPSDRRSPARQLAQANDGTWDEYDNEMTKNLDLDGPGSYSAHIVAGETGYGVHIYQEYRDYEGDQRDRVDARHFGTAEEARAWVDNWTQYA